MDYEKKFTTLIKYLTEYENCDNMCEYVQDNFGDYCESHCNFSCPNEECISVFVDLLIERN